MALSIVGFLIVSVAAYLTVAKNLKYQILEERPAGTFVADIGRDSELQAKLGTEIFRTLQYKPLRMNQPHVSYFNINPTSGVLVTAERIDREQVCPFDDACIISLDFAVQPAQYFQKIKVTIEIQDVNDISPSFPQSSTAIRISESVPVNFSYPLNAAIDGDTKVNSIIQYKLENGDGTFALDTTKNDDGFLEPRLVVRRALNRETTDSYSLKLTAFDGGIPPRFGSTLLNITVIDVNDNCPKFERESYHRTLPENVAPGSEVMTVSATDPDAGRNGQVQYRWTRRTLNKVKQTFELDPYTGVVKTRAVLDYDGQTSYRFGIVAYDGGQIPCSATASVLITLRDINDNKPEIVISTLSDSPDGQVSEYASNATFVVHVTVYDKDHGPNGNVYCSLSNSDEFALLPMPNEPSEFKLVTKATFDRERVSTYYVTIQCSDQGTPPLTTIKSFRVLVKDENDSPPQFVNSTYTTTVQENNVKGAFLLQVQAHDADTGANAALSYELHGEHAEWFKIGDGTKPGQPSSGIITAAIPLDAEKARVVNLQVIATDHGNPALTGTASVVINIIDINDNRPEFAQPSYRFELTENSDPGTFVGQISAQDKDVTSTGVIHYHFDENQRDFTKAFEISSNDGTITTREKLDREEKAVYNLVVRATDSSGSPLSSEVPVVIEILDLNDNGPVVTFPNNYNDTVYVSYLMGVGAKITRVLATDADAGMNGQLQFEYFQGEGLDKFLLNPMTGEITLAKALSAADKRSYRLVIIVKDVSGAEGNTKLVELNIVVTEPRTLPGFPQGESQNLLIVILLAASSALVSVFIIVLIIVIRSRDRHTHHYNARAEEQRKNASMMKNIELVMDCDSLKGRDMEMDRTFKSANHHPVTINDIEMGSTGSHHSATSTLLPANSDDGRPVCYQTGISQPDVTRVVSPESHHQHPAHIYHPSQPYSTISRQMDVASTCDSGKGNSIEDLSRNLREHREQSNRLAGTLPSQRPHTANILGGYHGNGHMQTFSPGRLQQHHHSGRPHGLSIATVNPTIKQQQPESPDKDTMGQNVPNVSESDMMCGASAVPIDSSNVDNSECAVFQNVNRTVDETSLYQPIGVNVDTRMDSSL